MNVLQIDEQRGWRGGEQQASLLIQGLVKRNHNVVLAGRPDQPFLKSKHNCDSLARSEAPFLSEFDLFTAWRIAKAVKIHKIDILHAHTSHTHSIACLARKIAGTGKVIAARRVSFPPKKGFLNRLKYNAPDRIIAVSECVRRVLIDYGLDPSCVTTVHSVVDPKRLDVEPIERSELGVPEGVPLLFNVGALVGHKDQRNLLKATAIAKQNVSNLKVLIAGEGHLRAKIESEIERLDLTKTVMLLGHRKDVPAIMRASDLYVSSSNSEGLGTSILDALVCQVPVVATLAGCADEIVKHGETGSIVPSENHEALAQAIIAALDNMEKSKKMAKQAREYVLDNFSVGGMVDGTIKVYESVLS